MNILNIDLDFFLNNSVLCEHPKGEERYDDKYTHPWDRGRVLDFLKHDLNLSGKTKGNIVKHHNEVFPIWRDLILSGEIQPPFKIVHVDMHADLGFTTNFEKNPI